MEATRAGTGCGACKELVGQILDWASGGGAEHDPSHHYYVPGVPLAKPELIEAVRRMHLTSVSSVFAALAEGVEDAGSKVGLASLLRMLWGAEYTDERDARFINDRVHANIQNDGTFSVVPQIPGGVTSPEQLRAIADVADKYQVPMVKITGGQRIDLLGVKKDDLPRVLPVTNRIRTGGAVTSTSGPDRPRRSDRAPSRGPVFSAVSRKRAAASPQIWRTKASTAATPSPWSR